MDLTVWFVLATVLFAVQAEKTEKKSQKLPSETPETQKQPQKRHQGIQMKEVVLYLTPSQIKALNTGHGLMNPEAANKLQAQISGIPENLQKRTPQEEEELRKELAEADRKNREILAAVQNQQSIDLKKHEQPTTQLLPLQGKLPQPELKQQYISPSNGIPQPLYKSSHLPENYAYLYFYPGQGSLPQFKNIPPPPQFQQFQKNVQILPPPVNPKLQFLPEKFQLIPYEYGVPRRPEVQFVQEAQSAAYELPELPTEPLPQLLKQSQPLAAHPTIEVVQQTEIAHQLSEALQEAMPFLAQELNTGHLQDLEFHKIQPQQLEFQHFGTNRGIEEIKAHQDQLEAQGLAAHLELEHQKQELQAQFEAEKLKNIQEQLDVQNLKNFQANFEDQNLKNLQANFDAQNLKNLQANIEAQNLENIHKQLEAENFKNLQANLEAQNLKNIHKQLEAENLNLQANLDAQNFKNLQANLEAQNLENIHKQLEAVNLNLQANIEGQNLKNLQANSEAQNLKNIHKQFEAENSKNLQANLEVQNLKNLQANFEPHDLKNLQPNLETQNLKNQQANLEVQNLKNIHEHLEAVNLKNIHENSEAEKITELHAHLEQEKLKQLDAENFRNAELEAHFKALESEKRFQSEVKKSQFLKANILSQQKREKEHLDALSLDAHHQILEIEAEAGKSENKFTPLFVPSQKDGPDKLELFEPNVGQFDTLLSPFHHSVIEQFKQKLQFEKNPPLLERGFRPLKYEVKNDEAKYAKEVEKILKNAQIEKLEDLNKAATDAQLEVLTLLKDGESLRTPQIEKLKVPVPYYVTVPQPKPYAVPLEIINHVPVPVLKVEKLEVEKPVPYEVEKHVPVTVTKNVYVPVEKPYILEKRVPVEIRKKIPVKVERKQKFTLVRHVWEH